MPGWTPSPLVYLNNPSDPFQLACHSFLLGCSAREKLSEQRSKVQPASAALHAFSPRVLTVTVRYHKPPLCIEKTLCRQLCTSPRPGTLNRKRGTQKSEGSSWIYARRGGMDDERCLVPWFSRAHLRPSRSARSARAEWSSCAFRKNKVMNVSISSA
jgi:hypothetical protein